MKDKIQLVKEETGCDEEQAKLTLESTHNDVSKAIRIINTLLKHIIAIKGKFKCEKINVYGIFLFIINIRQRRLVRVGALVSYNPSIYENDLDMNWHDFEKHLYSLRLGEGSLQDLTQNLQNCLQIKLNRDESKNFYQHLRNLDKREIDPILLSEIKTVTGDQEAVLNTSIEQLNLAQFKELRKDIGNEGGESSYGEERRRDPTIILKIELILDSLKGCAAKNLKKGDLILAKIIDIRDIAQYLSTLLGGKQQEEIIPLVASVENVEIQKDQVIVKTRFSPGIIGRTTLSSDNKVKIIGGSKPIVAFIKRKIIFIVSILIMLTIILIWIIYK